MEPKKEPMSLAEVCALACQTTAAVQTKLLEAAGREPLDVENPDQIRMATFLRDAIEAMKAVGTILACLSNELHRKAGGDQSTVQE